MDFKIENSLLKFNEINQNRLEKQNLNKLNYECSKQSNLLYRDHLRDLDINTDYKSTTLNISPEEFTITELNNPEIEETLMKNSSGGFNSTTQHTSATLKNIPIQIKESNSNNEIWESNMRRQLNQFYNKNPYKINSFEEICYPNHCQFFNDDKIIIQDCYMNGSDQDDAKIIETEEAEANDLIIHRSPNEISSIDLANGIGEISDFCSSDNMTNMILSHDRNAQNFSSNFRTDNESKCKIQEGLESNHNLHKQQKASICLPNMLFFRNK